MTSGYIVRCATGRRALPAFPEGKFLGWVGGYLTPLCQPECATRYAGRKIAADVASRAETAYPGARFAVERLKS